jgi:hypothetical protein
MFCDKKERWTMRDLLEYLKRSEQFPQYLDKPIRLWSRDYDQEPMYLSLVGESCSVMDLLFQPESYFIK